MSWKKRPTTIKTIKESTLVTFNQDILPFEEWEETERTAFPRGIEQPERILTGDLSYA